MTKINVSKEVAKVLKEAKENSGTMFGFIHQIVELKKFIYADWLKDNNLTEDDLINCYKYDWEEEYEFQIGDVIQNKSGELLFIGEENSIATGHRSVDYVNKFKGYYTLICKDKNREDKKGRTANV